MASEGLHTNSLFQELSVHIWQSPTLALSPFPFLPLLPPPPPPKPHSDSQPPPKKKKQFRSNSLSNFSSSSSSSSSAPAPSPLPPFPQTGQPPPPLPNRPPTSNTNYAAEAAAGEREIFLAYVCRRRYYMHTREYIGAQKEEYLFY